MEQVRARVGVLAPLALGFQRATLVFTESRMIVAFVGKRSSRYLIWPEGRFLSGLFKSGGESRRRELAESYDPEKVLASNPSNFTVPYGEVVGVQLTLSQRRNNPEIVMVTNQDKLVFRLVSESLPEEFENELSRLLGDRFSSGLSVRR